MHLWLLIVITGIIIIYILCCGFPCRHIFVAEGRPERRDKTRKLRNVAHVVCRGLSMYIYIYTYNLNHNIVCDYTD